MSEGRLINVFCWKPDPGLQWRCYEGVSGITVDAESKEAAVDHFNSIWNFRTPVQWIYEAPKRPRRPGDASPQADKLLEHESAFRKSLLRHFHSDLIGSTRRFSADQVVSAINDAWESTRPK